jgi:hypothetical protein
MTHDLEGASGITTKHNGEARRESVGNSRTDWQCPNITIIDIRRTMLFLGSVTDGISGSF